MKFITKVLSILTGAISSLCSMGCQKEPECIYGPPAMLKEYQHTGKINHSRDMGENEEKPDLPESDGVPEKIYGPPEMLNNAEKPELPESDGVPEKIYGPPEMLNNAEKPDLPESDGVPEKIYGPPEMLNNDTNDQDFETLKKVNQSRKDGKLVYGPPPHRDR